MWPRRGWRNVCWRKLRPQQRTDPAILVWLPQDKLLSAYKDIDKEESIIKILRIAYKSSKDIFTFALEKFENFVPTLRGMISASHQVTVRSQGVALSNLESRIWRNVARRIDKSIFSHYQRHRTAELDWNSRSAVLLMTTSSWLSS